MHGITLNIREVKLYTHMIHKKIQYHLKVAFTAGVDQLVEHLDYILEAHIPVSLEPPEVFLVVLIGLFSS